MKVTIITPCYNSAPYIATTIKSVQEQTFTDWEMIVVDDGSTDHSATIVSEIAEIESVAEIECLDKIIGAVLPKICSPV